MSGQPYRYSTDKEMYRAGYMKNLQDRIDLDEQVFQAVKGYVSNGTLPAVSQIPDTRSTAQKLLDVQKLKQDLIKDLVPIMDQTIASNFIQALVQSPLNIDNKLVVFLAQNAGELVKELSKKYKYGIKGDANDIYTFVEFINNSYALINNTKASLKSVMDSGYSKPGAGIINRYELQSFITDLMKAFGQATISQLPGFDRDAINVLLELIRNKIDAIVRDLPDDEQFKAMERHLVTGRNFLDEQENKRITELFGWMKEKLPNKQYIISLSNSVSSEIMNGLRTGETNTEMIRKSLKAIYDLLPETDDLPDVGAIMDIIDGEDDNGDDGDGEYNFPNAPSKAIDNKMNILQKRMDQLGPGEPDNTATDELRSRLDALKSDPQMTDEQKKAMLDALQKRFDALQIPDIISNPVGENPLVPKYLTYLQKPSQEPIPDAGSYRLPGVGVSGRFDRPLVPSNVQLIPGTVDLPPGPGPSGAEPKAFRLKSTDIKDEMDKNNVTMKALMHKKDLMDDSIMKTEDEIGKKKAVIERFKASGMTKSVKKNQDELGNMETELTRLREGSDQLEKLILDHGAEQGRLDTLYKSAKSTGNGFKKRLGRPKGTGFKQNIEKHIDVHKGIEPDYRFSKFGKYLIRNDHLMDNTVSIRTGKGMNITGLPSTKTNPRIVSIIKKIIGGALPSFDEMNKLTEPEKEYLHKISKKSNILEKVNIPTPSKDKEEKDFNEFEILRGEIMAGNDNKDMVRKFKGFLLKFSKTGQLPKQQVNEILQDMLDMNL